MRLPGRRYVFTNGARGYAHRVLDRLSVAHCFDGVFAIEDGDLTPKPNPATFRRMLGRAILTGLELLVAADIIRTVAIDPTLESVAILGLIVIIRTFLSFSLEVEIYGRLPWQKRAPKAGSGQPAEAGGG